jgi:hypothetical protein
MDILQKSVERLKSQILEACPDAEIEESAETTANHHDFRLTVRLPSDWSANTVDDFQDWARKLTYDILMDSNIDIEVNVFNLTWDQQELLKWIYLNFPEITTETLVASGIGYDRALAGELYEFQDKRTTEQVINLSDTARKDRDYILEKYGKKERTIVA